MNDIAKIAATLDLARSRLTMLAGMNIVNLDAAERARLNAKYLRAVRDVAICQRDLKTAIDQEGK